MNEGYEQYDRVTGGFTTTAYKRVWRNVGTCPAVTVVSGETGPTTFPTTAWVSTYSGAYPINTPTSTRLQYYNGCYYDHRGNFYATASDSSFYQFDLEDEDTEEDAIARAAATPGTASVALRTARSAGQFGFSITTVTPTVTCRSLTVGVVYRVSYTLRTTPLRGGAAETTPVELFFEASSTEEVLTLDTLSPTSGYSQELEDFSIVFVP